MKKIAPWFAGFILFFSPFFYALTSEAFQKDSNGDIYDLSLEDLMNLEVVTATKSLVKVADAPAAMTVVTAEDIKRYGYRDLSEALARVPEVYTRYEGHNFGSDFRGFFANNTRRQVLYLLNGHRINDRFHFGDFYPDVIGDLSDVERIEVLRGPGAALYGNNAILGVVNIITRDAGELDVSQTDAGASFSVNQIANESAVYKYQADLRRRFSDRMSLSMNAYWFDGDILYDTRTSAFDRPWTGSQAHHGSDQADIQTYTDFYYDVDDASFDGGERIPNFNLRFNAGDVTLGSFSHTKAATWVWPKDNLTFNHPDNIRSWGTGAVFLEWQPKECALSKYDILTRLSYNINTNREISDYSTADGVGGMSLSQYRLTGIYAAPRWLRDGNGMFYDYTSTLDDALFSDDSADANGGGSQFNYAGVDKSVGLEFQLTPYKTDFFTLQAGANYEDARYENYQWYEYRNGEFIGWSPFGGVTDEGWYMGAWAQATVKPMDRLFFISGLRYDYQKVEAVYRQLGGDQLYQEAAGGYAPIRKDGVSVDDFSPRLAVNYYFNDTDNIRLIYARAFRAVPPQELIRLPESLSAESEETNDCEAIGSFKLSDQVNFTANAFYLENNITYQWSPAVSSFSEGSGWRNTGGSIALNYVNEYGLEAWTSVTAYRLRRPTDALRFMTGEPNQYEPLDSPESLFKAGASYRTQTKTTLAAEIYYNSSITIYTPAVNNVEDPVSADVFTVYDVPGSFSLNAAVRQDLSIVGLDRCYCLFKIDNILDTDVWYGLNMDAQSSWDYTAYSRPSQLPGFGRRFYVQAGYRF
jgi:outer membrane receptor protein involved in Fe transport